jgi:hypothetical protein
MSEITRAPAIGACIFALLALGCNVIASLGSGLGEGAGGGGGTGGAGGAGGGGRGGGDQAGVWTNVTPQGMSLDPDSPPGNFGVRSVVADPARPGDFYAFASLQGAWRSTDYGLSWTKVSTGKSGATLDAGQPRAAAIASDASRDPSSEPPLFASNGAVANPGLFKSIDGGTSWTRCSLPGDASAKDVNSLDVDPNDADHLLAALYAAPGFLESTDGGATWRSVPSADEMGTSLTVFFIDTGTASTTRATWLARSSLGMGSGTWRTENSGASWSRVEAVEHGNGADQIFQADGIIHMAGFYGSGGDGIYRSADQGATWVLAASGTSSIVFGTRRYIYAATAHALVDPAGPRLMRAPRDDGTPWASVATPSGMMNGAARAAVSRDARGRDVVVSGNFLAGIWRYVED